MNVTLVIILVVLILLGIWGWFSGFIKMVCVFCSSIIVLVLTLFLSPITTEVFTKSESIYGFFHEKVASAVDLRMDSLQISLDQLNMVELPEGTLESSVVEELRELAGEMELSTVDPVELVRDRITLMLIKAAAFIVTYIIVSLLVGLAFKVFNILSKLPVINVANKALGVASGVAVGIFFVLVFMAVADFLSPSVCEGVAEDINSSAILGWIHEHNFISPFVNSFLKD